MTEIVIASIVVFAAYFLKGFSGFGPALVMIPFFTLLFDPSTAINVTTLYDFLSGCLLIFSVRRELNWRFIMPVFTALGLGAVFGSLLLGILPLEILKKLIGAVILVFAIVILFQKNNHSIHVTGFISKLKYPVGFFSGFLGGLLSISGPPLIIYMKMLYEKDFFRTQLIGIFVLGAGWRYFLYYLNGIPMNLSWNYMLIFFVIMLAGLFVGSRVQLKVNETVFNKVVALVLFFPALKLLM